LTKNALPSEDPVNPVGTSPGCLMGETTRYGNEAIIFVQRPPPSRVLQNTETPLLQPICDGGRGPACPKAVPSDSRRQPYNIPNSYLLLEIQRDKCRSSERRSKCGDSHILDEIGVKRKRGRMRRERREMRGGRRARVSRSRFLI
jgi:hypothetical protein